MSYDRASAGEGVLEQGGRGDWIEWHAPVVIDDNDTLCGMVANDFGVGTYGRVEPRRGQQITRVQCHIIWSETLALKLHESNFALIQYSHAVSNRSLVQSAGLPVAFQRPPRRTLRCVLRDKTAILGRELSQRHAYAPSAMWARYSRTSLARP